MKIQSELHKASLFNNLELLANQVVEGFISGIHKSPFHGFSAEFAEHKIYNMGESTRHIDWKLFAKTDKFYTKRYEEETNLRCHMILDNSASMYYPAIKNMGLDNLNKIGFSVLAIASLMTILKKQRDAVGLSIFSDEYNFYTPEKGSERHHQRLLSKLSEVSLNTTPVKQTETYKYLHQIAEKVKRRSLIILFTDMLQTLQPDEQLFEALRHLKYNKHDVVLFHVLDAKTEQHFDFDNRPKRYLDVETGQHIDVFSNTIKEAYEEEMTRYFNALKLNCAKYKIKYVPVDIQEPFAKILNAFMIERQRFAA